MAHCRLERIDGYQHDVIVLVVSLDSDIGVQRLYICYLRCLRGVRARAFVIRRGHVQPVDYPTLTIFELCPRLRQSFSILILLDMLKVSTRDSLASFRWRVVRLRPPLTKAHVVVARRR